MVGFGGAAGGEISHFFYLSKSPRGETSKNSGVWGPIGTTKPQNWGRGQRDPKPTARPATCLLVLPLPLRMSLSFSFLAAWEHDGAPPGHLCAFGSAFLCALVRGCSKVCMRAQLCKRENARACLGAVSWFFVVFSIALTIAPSTSAATPVRHFSHFHALICALFCAFAPARKRFVRRTAHTSLLFVVCVFSQSECSFSGFFFNFSSFSNLAEIHLADAGQLAAVPETNSRPLSDV